MDEEWTHIERQKAFELYAFTPIMNTLGIPPENVDNSKECPDIRFEYNGKQIGIEVIDCYPKSFNGRRKFAIDGLYNQIKDYLESKSIYGHYAVCLKDSVCEVSRISTIKRTLFEEVEGLIKGILYREQCKYVDEVRGLQWSAHNNRTIICPFERMMHPVMTPPISDIITCVKKKNALYHTYIKDLDEVWLLIYIPTNENYYSVKGIPRLSDSETNFRRIYVTDYMFNSKLIYERT
jgi:hypothetical protein